MAPRRRSRELDPSILESINKPAAKSAGAETEKPDYIDIDGVRYYREKPQMEVVDPMKVDVTRPGYSRIVINVAPHSKEIKIDNRIFSAGHVYEIRDDQVQTFVEVMARTWQHERAVGGANTNAMVGARNDMLNLQTQVSRMNRGPAGVPGN